MKRYLKLAGAIMICLSLLAACGKTPTSTAGNPGTEATMDMGDASGDVSSDSSDDTYVYETDETQRTNIFEVSTPSVGKEDESSSRYGGKILVDGKEIDYESFNGHLRVDEGSSHIITLSGFEQYYQDVEYTWKTWQEKENGTYTPISISNSSEIETDKIYKSWYYGVTINYSRSNLSSITSPELHFNFQFDVENHFRIYPSDADDTTIDQRSNDWFYTYVSFPDDEESILLSVEVLGDNLDGVSLKWMKHGYEVDYEEIEGKTGTDLILYKEEFDGDVCQRVCWAQDKFNNILYLVFTIELENK